MLEAQANARAQSGQKYYVVRALFTIAFEAASDSPKQSMSPRGVVIGVRDLGGPRALAPRQQFADVCRAGGPHLRQARNGGRACATLVP